MDVRFINPFLEGAKEVLKTMAFIDAVPGKAYLKKVDIAHGDVSGIIGITGDAIGSLAVSFHTDCICGIVSSMLGENHTEPTSEVLDAVGELTNMISGVARTQLEKKGFSVYAAIPSVVVGAGHTISHILKVPSIVIPFSTALGDFVVDVCIKPTEDHLKHEVIYDVVNKPTLPQGKIVDGKPKPKDRPALPPAQAASGPADAVEALAPLQAGDYQSRISRLKATLNKLIHARDDIQRSLDSNPFMLLAKRKEQKKRIDVYDAKIRKIKLDISTAQVLAKMPDNNEEPEIKRHFQDYVRKNP
ncbi:MAG TPA: chemotaxis protein CheX [Syntrophales bacterium]|jgi:chemotaxis protein CheX|nr:chemotaxis protein CheX [Syntrophales bacterium]HPX55828.1 chemotaxis protein CheX [Syntrophales bacterium]HQA83134.1 chemotaxis protein CheX [Syntrophales bacterium]